MNNPEQLPVEVVSEANAITSMIKGEVDIQIQTAKQYPRVISKSKERILEVATSDQETADSCFYLLPRGGKSIEGPSTRLAEIVANSWGNLRIGSRVLDVGEKSVVCQGVVHDLETNVAYQTEVRRKITDRNGKRYTEDMINMTANAGCSIAMRNAIFKAVPKAVIKTLEKEIKHAAGGDARTLPTRIKTAFKYFKDKYSHDEKKLLAFLDKRKMEDVDLEDLQKLNGVRVAIEDGELTAANAFSLPEEEKPKQKKKGIVNLEDVKVKETE